MVYWAGVLTCGEADEVCWRERCIGMSSGMEECVEWAECTSSRKLRDDGGAQWKA